MEKVVINCPLGFVLIEGNEDGISKISVTSEETILSETIPELFRETELIFSLKLIRMVLIFKRKFGKNY